MNYFWMIVPLVVAIYCIARAIVDIRSKNYVWAAFGLICGGFILTMPIETHAVKIDLPAPSSPSSLP